MCYDFNTSISTWIIAQIIAIFLYYRDKGYDRWVSIFIATFSVIQLLEAGIWKSIEWNNELMNDIITRIILVAIWSQPCVQSYYGWKNSKSPLLFILTLLCFVALIYATFRSLTSKQMYSICGKNKHLSWNDKSMPGYFVSKNKLLGLLYFSGIFLPLLVMKPNLRKYALLGTGISSGIISYKTTTFDEFSSKWCWYGIAYGIIALFT